MSWLIRGVVPAIWVVFDAQGVPVAQGVAINRRRARRDVREAMEMYSEGRP